MSDLAQAGPAPIASEALARIAGLYRIDDEIRSCSADERRAVRRERSRPIIEALRYAPSRWPGRILFLDDRQVEIDSSVVERTIGRLALNRKNALCAGLDGGAEHWTVVASLTQTWKLIAVEPYAYLADVITRMINDHPHNCDSDTGRGRSRGEISKVIMALQEPEDIATNALKGGHPKDRAAQDTRRSE